MIGQDLIINLQGDQAYLTETKSIPLDRTNIIGHYRKFPPASWKVRVINYTPSKRKIFAEVVTYNAFQLEFPDHQFSENAELHDVETIEFKSINTDGLLRSYSGNKTAEPYYPTTEVPPMREEQQKSSNRPEKLTGEIKETFQISIEKIQFKLGHVVFTHYIDRLGRSLEFAMHNPELKEEFDAVKNYFANVLKKKELEFNVIVSVRSGEVIRIVTNSLDIARIDKRIVEQSRFEFAKGILRNSSNLEGEQSVFTLDELIDATITKNAKLSYYDRDEKFLEDLLQITDTKHYQHLRFLSDKHLHGVMKLRFGVKPFSFIFLLEGTAYFYFVWETLNTEEATYVWQVEKNILNLRVEAQKIDAAITSIRIYGKQHYLRTAGSGFVRVFHDYSEDVDGFAKWKKILEGVVS